MQGKSAASRDTFFELEKLLSRLYKRNCRQRTLTQYTLYIKKYYLLRNGCTVLKGRLMQI